jgi:hypothetical protein
VVEARARRAQREGEVRLGLGKCRREAHGARERIDRLGGPFNVEQQQTEMIQCVRIIRHEREGAVQMAVRLIVAAQQAQRLGEIAVRGRIVGLTGDHCLITFHGRCRAREELQRLRMDE